MSAVYLVAALQRDSRALSLRARLAGATLVLKILSVIAPRLAARWLDRQFWHRPMRYPEPEREHLLRATGEPFPIAYKNKRLAGYAWGKGPLVLLVHGWSGRGLQLGALIEPLVQHGYRIATFDAPGHGRSPGRYTNFPAMAEIIEYVITHHGPLHAIVAHSGGCTAALLAAQRAPDVKRLVCFSPTSLRGPLLAMYRQLRVSPRVAQHHERGLFARYGESMHETYSPQRLVQSVRMEGLIVHDDNDPEAPLIEGKSVLREWPGARLVTTHGLGHTRLLRDPDVVREVTTFIVSPEPTQRRQMQEKY